MADDNPKQRRASRIRKLCWITVLVLLAGWVVPLTVRVNFWQQEVAAALSDVLGRPVQVGDLHLRFVGGPGFDVSNVVVEEDPAFGAEPFARMESVQADVALSSLWHGRIEFSSLHLISPSFNVARDADGQWNLAKLGGSPGHSSSVRPSAAHSSAAQSEVTKLDSAKNISGATKPDATEPDTTKNGARTFVLPHVHVEAGRINFKSGDRKRAYRFESVDLELTPPTSLQQPWRFHFEGMPTRTDLPFRSTSPLQASGEVGPMNSGLPQEAGVPLHLDWNADNNMLAEVLTIITGRDLGVHGVLNLRGHLVGTTSLFRISAEGEVRELHRWDLRPTAGDSSLRATLAGIVDLSTDSVELSSLTIPLGGGSVVVRGGIENIFDLPRPRIEAEFQQTSLAALAKIAPQFSTRLPRGLQADGALQGRIRIEGSPGYLSGNVIVSSGFIQPSASSEPVHFATFPVTLAGPKGSLGPVRATPAQGGPAQLSVEWDATKRATSWKLTGERISIPALARLAADIGWGSNYLQVSEGNLGLRMDVRTSQGERPRVAGWARISGAVISRAVISRAVMESRTTRPPLRISDARVQFQRNRIQVQPLWAEMGPAVIEGTIAMKIPTGAADTLASPPPVPNVEFTLASQEIDIAEIAAAFTPAARTEGFFGFGGDDAPASSPLDLKLAAAWNYLHARGTYQADSLRYRGVNLKDFHSSIYIHDRQVEIADFSADHAGGAERGSAALNFAPGLFAFTLDSQYANLDLAQLTQSSERWRGVVSGEVSGTLHLAGSGRTLDEVISQLNGSGVARGVQLALRGERWAEALGMADTQESHFASLSSDFQIGRRSIHVSEMNLIPTRTPVSSSVIEIAEKGLHPTSWLISGDVGFDQRLDLQVRTNPEENDANWAGTLAEPLITREVATREISARDLAVREKTPRHVASRDGAAGSIATATSSSRTALPPPRPMSGASIPPKQASIP